MNRPLPPPPPELAAIVQAIGAEAALRLVETFGGTAVKLADQPRRSSVVHCIGLEAAQALGAAFGRGMLRVPLARSWRVHVYHAQGLSQKQIALKVGMTESGVFRVLRQEPTTQRRGTPAGQGSLFL